MADVTRSSESESEPVDGAESSAGRGIRGKRSGRKGSFWRELVILIVSALVLTVLIQTFLGRLYVIPSQSMERTLHGCTGCTNDQVLVDKVSYDFSDPRPGNVVVFRGPDTWEHNESRPPSNPVAGLLQGVTGLLGFGAPGEKDFVKRVIATEGQTVSCCDPQNRVLVDGKPLTEPYVFYQSGHGAQQRPFAPVRVPPGHIWVMGDNRNNSLDSRYQGGGGAPGAVPVDNVIGKAQFVVLPFTRWQGVADPNPQVGTP